MTCCICNIILHFDFDCSKVEDEELIALTLSTGHVRERNHFVDAVCFDPPLATFFSSCSSLLSFSLPPPFRFLIFGLPVAQHDIPLVVFVLLLNVLEDEDRSEERRVGKEGRSRGSPYH